MLAREALAKDGKLEATLQACAEDAARRSTPFFVLPQGTAATQLTLTFYCFCACNHRISLFKTMMCLPPEKVLCVLEFNAIWPHVKVDAVMALTSLSGQHSMQQAVSQTPKPFAALQQPHSRLCCIYHQGICG